MAKTYAQIAKQIEALQQQADALKKKEIAGVVARIREAVAFYKLTAEDLGLGAVKAAKSAAPADSAAPKAAPARKRRKTGKRPSVIRYRDALGNSWTGVGRKPGWIIAGLAAGKTLADFAAPAADSGTAA